MVHKLLLIHQLNIPLTSDKTCFTSVLITSMTTKSVQAHDLLLVMISVVSLSW